MQRENEISKANNVLLVLAQAADASGDLRYLIDHFCGAVVYALAEVEAPLGQRRLYVCGDVGLLGDTPVTALVIRELSWSHEDRLGDRVQVIGLGAVPIVLHDVGVYFRRLFDEDDLFARIKAAHQFQHLTESTKPAQALRQGIYLTDVSRQLVDGDHEVLHYRLLRCSSNLTGPTDNLRETDRMIMRAINAAARGVFTQETSLNHVLAQIYENQKESGSGKREKKAKIGAHSDKTKDMREDGLIAFCTFYDPASFGQLKPSKADPYDWCYKETTGLTRLHFRRKSTVEDPGLVREFSVTLYPNSVFIIPLSTNRLFTHEIRPSTLRVDQTPTRMGYVVRCSKAEAVFMNAQTYLKADGALIKLAQMSHEDINDLRRSYFQENTTADHVAYGQVHFSMNAGDYQKPIY
jgi:hypothetical protein